MRFTIATALALVASAPEALADPDGGTVNGTVTLPTAEERSEPPVRNRGFFERMPNAVRPPKKLDPRPEIVILLVGGEPHPDDESPPNRPVEYDVVGESFEVEVLPVVSGSKIEVVNRGKKSPRLYCPDFPELLDGDPVSPNGERDFKQPVGAPFEIIEIRDKDSAHLRGRILSLPHAYASVLDGEGKFTIEGVPAGTWTVRVWYQGGFVKLPAAPTVEVRGKRTATVTVALPAALEVTGPGEED